MFDHMTTRFSNFVSNSDWDSFYFVVAVSVLLFVRNMGYKFVEQRINSLF